MISLKFATDNVLLACMASVLLFLDLTDDRVRFMMLAVSKSVRRAMKIRFNFSKLWKRSRRLGARLEELSAQTLNELVGIMEHISPVVERQRYNSAAAEEKIVLVVACSGFKRSRNSLLVIAKPKQVLAIFNAPACGSRNRLKLSVFWIWLSSSTSELLFNKARLFKS
jgi:hypothetical protein